MDGVPAEETALDALRHTVTLLAKSYDRTRADLAKEIERFHTGLQAEPEDMRDQHGRYILLDALTALVQAQTVIAATEQRQGG
jgi:hypothetical protein